MKSLEPGDEDSPAVFGVPVSYWLDLKDYDPVADAAKIGMPMLILQGGRDPRVRWCSPAEAASNLNACSTARG